MLELFTRFGRDAQHDDLMRGLHVQLAGTLD